MRGGKIKVVLSLAVLACAATASPLLAQDKAQGHKLYLTYCSSCHGEDGKGDGVAAGSLPVKPADHTDGKFMNQLSDKYLHDIIAKGGTGVGKSAFMPAWEGQLKAEEIQAIVLYLRSIAKPPSKPSPR